MPLMRFEEMNWQGVEAYLKQDDRLMLVLGACEQHSTLSLLTDSKIPQALADEASKLTGVAVAPALHFGISPYFLAYPGTISLRVSTYMAVIADKIHSLYGCGFRRVLILNGHGGNTPAKAALVELANELPGLRTRWYSWWMSPGVNSFSQAHGLINAHANWEENFPFTRIGKSPKGEKLVILGSLENSNARETRELAGDGSYGGPWQVDDSLVQEMFDICLDEVVHLLDFG